MKYTLTLVRLSDEQISAAKTANGSRKKTSHALLCGPHGKIFGTEKQIRKYYDVWKRIFPNIFDRHVETDDFAIYDFESTVNLVNILIAENNRHRGNVPTLKTERKKSFLARLLG